jgi:hypothetical protein
MTYILVFPCRKIGTAVSVTIFVAHGGYFHYLSRQEIIISFLLSHNPFVFIYFPSFSGISLPSFVCSNIIPFLLSFLLVKRAPSPQFFCTCIHFVPLFPPISSPVFLSHHIFMSSYHHSFPYLATAVDKLDYHHILVMAEDNVCPPPHPRNRRRKCGISSTY